MAVLLYLMHYLAKPSLKKMKMSGVADTKAEVVPVKQMQAGSSSSPSLEQTSEIQETLKQPRATEGEPQQQQQFRPPSSSSICASAHVWL